MKVLTNKINLNCHAFSLQTLKTLVATEITDKEEKKTFRTETIRRPTYQFSFTVMNRSHHVSERRCIESFPSVINLINYYLKFSFDALSLNFLFFDKNLTKTFSISSFLSFENFLLLFLILPFISQALKTTKRKPTLSSSLHQECKMKRKENVFTLKRIQWQATKGETKVIRERWSVGEVLFATNEWSLCAHGDCSLMMSKIKLGEQEKVECSHHNEISSKSVKMKVWQSIWDFERRALFKQLWASSGDEH